MALNVLSTFKDIASDSRLIEDVREIVISRVLKENLTDYFTIVPGIKGGKQVAAMRGIEKITFKDTGCDPNFMTPNFPALTQVWEPTRASVRIKFCHKDFEAKFTQWALGNGYDVKKLDEADFFQFILDFVTEAMERDILRLGLMGDADIASQSILKNASDAAAYDVVKKGLLPTLQYFNTITELQDNFVELSKNSGTSQQTLTADYAKGIYEEVVDVMDFDGDSLFSNHALYKNYSKWMKNALELESSKSQVQQGIPNLIIDGERITPIKNYDRWRKNDFTVSNHTHLPHFALFTKKEYLQIGVDSEAALSDLIFEYPGGSDENFYIKANYMIDFKMTNPYEFKAAI